MKFSCPGCKASYTIHDFSLLEKNNFVFQCTNCSRKFKLKPPAAHNNEEKKPVVTNTILGWLQVKGTKETFPLRMGLQTIGRKSSNVQVDIAIDTTDRMMGRKHCSLKLNSNTNAQTVDFIFWDEDSVNGSFLEGPSPVQMAPQDQYILQDGDAIRLGQTILILKKNMASIKELFLEQTPVATNADALKTMIIKK